MKDEAPYILEWVAHHKALGVEDFIVFSADCDDGTDHMLERLDRLGYLRHAPNPKRIFRQIPSWQVGALRYATKFARYEDAQWIITVDADEFVDVTVGRHRLKDLFEATEPFDLMSFTVLGHNSNRVRGIGDGKVQGVFTRPGAEFSAFDNDAPPKVASVKTLMRAPQPTAMFRNHRPKFKDFPSTNQRWVDGSGREMSDHFTNNKVNSLECNGSLDLGRVNHYSIRSMDSFLVKVNRGNPLTGGSGLKLDQKAINVFTDYWTRRNVGLDNTPIKHHVPYGYKALHKTLMDDPILSDLHEGAISIHKQTVELVLNSDSGRIIAEAMGYFETEAAE
ncbi:glycosyltransferase family 2 protein [Gymnodinialimonas sp.]